METNQEAKTTRAIEAGVTTIPGLEDLARSELESLNIQVLDQSSGILRLMIDPYRLPILLTDTRFILRVLLPIVDGEYRSVGELQNRLSRYDWSRYLSTSHSFRIDGVGKSTFAASHYIPLTIKDSLVDYFRNKQGTRPEVDTKHPDILFIAYMKDSRLILYRDAAGVPLSHHGYRTNALEAPLNELIAGSLPRFLGWEGRGLFIDPMCGSGTIAIEACLQALGQFPQQYRPQPFSLGNWPDKKSFGWNHRHEKDPGSEPKTLPEDCRIIGADILKVSPGVAQENAQRALIASQSIQWEVEAFEYLHANPVILEAREWARENNVPTFLCFNPPFDQRMQLNDAKGFYQNLGDIAKNHWTGTRMGIFTAHLDAAKAVGLRTTRKIPIKNGPLDCRLFIYDLY